MIKEYAKGSTVPALDHTFDILEYLKQSGTRWSMVYDIKNRQIHYTTPAHPGATILKLADYDFACGAENLMLEIGEVFENNQAQFHKYSAQLNKEVVTFFGATIPKVPGEIWEKMAKYSDSVQCDR